MESGNGKCIDLVSSDDDVSSSDDEVVEVGVVEARRVSSPSKVKCRGIEGEMKTAEAACN